MGGTAHVVVHAARSARATELVARARLRLVELDRAWSRFLPESDVCRLNDSQGRPVDVHEDTVTLVRRAAQGWSLTGGHFDPTVLGSMLAYGYDRDFVRVGRADGPHPEHVRPAPGCRGIEIDSSGRRVRLPIGVRFDPGGIGQGLAADLVCDELLRAGATGALVNVGGDVRVGGSPPDRDGWVVAVADPQRGGRELVRIRLRRGAVATSSTLGRRWLAGGRPVHHLMDPRSGEPVDGPLASVTVTAESGWWAEVLAKAILVAGDPEAVRRGPAAEFVAVTHDGSRLCSPGFRRAAGSRA